MAPVHSFGCAWPWVLGPVWSRNGRDRQCIVADYLDCNSLTFSCRPISFRLGRPGQDHSSTRGCQTAATSGRKRQTTSGSGSCRNGISRSQCSARSHCLSTRVQRPRTTLFRMLSKLVARRRSLPNRRPASRSMPDPSLKTTTSRTKYPRRSTLR